MRGSMEQASGPKIFLVVRPLVGIGTLCVLPDVDAALAEVRRIQSDPSAACGLYFGVDCDVHKRRCISRILKDQAGAAFLSESMIARLPDPRADMKMVFGAPRPVICEGRAKVLLFRRAPEGLHQLMDRDALVGASFQSLYVESRMRSPHAAPAPVDRDPQDWITKLRLSHPDMILSAQNIGIHDERSYQRLESTLSARLRLDLGLARMDILTGHPLSRTSLLKDLWAAPPWLLNWPLEFVPLCNRHRRIAVVEKMRVVADLIPFIRRISLAGNFSYFDVIRGGVRPETPISKVLLHEMVNAYPLRGSAQTASFVVQSSLSGADSEQVTANFRSDSFLSELDGILLEMDERDRTIWTLRMGYKCKSETLEVIGKTCGISRERAGDVALELEFGGRAFVSYRPLWRTLDAKLRAILASSTKPVLVADLPSIDPWFSGLDEPAFTPSFLGNVLSRMLGNPLAVLMFDDMSAVSPLCRSKWDSQKEVALSALTSMRESGEVTESSFRKVCDKVLPKEAKTLREVFFKQVSADIIWSKQKDRSVMNIGRPTAERMCLAVLSQSDHPMHFNDVFKEARRHYGCKLTHKALLRFLQSTAFVFARGVYGLERHLKLKEEERLEIRAVAEKLFASTEHGSQLHANQILIWLTSQGLDYGDRLNHFTLSHALKESAHAVDLGNLLWGVRHEGHDGLVSKPDAAINAGGRVDQKAMIIDLLERAGRPMGRQEIRDAALTSPGLNPDYQVLFNEKIIRISRGVLGLRGRDTPEQVPAAHGKKNLKHKAKALACTP